MRKAFFYSIIRILKTPSNKIPHQHTILLIDIFLDRVFLWRHQVDTMAKKSPIDNNIRSKEMIYN